MASTIILTDLNNDIPIFNQKYTTAKSNFSAIESIIWNKKRETMLLKGKSYVLLILRNIVLNLNHYAMDIYYLHKQIQL